MPKKIAAFGEVMMRLQVPGYELLSQANTLNYSFSGTGVNVASALARFGHKVYLVTSLPENPIGDAAVSHIQQIRNSVTVYFKRRKIRWHVFFRKWIWCTSKSCNLL